MRGQTQTPSTGGPAEEDSPVINKRHDIPGWAILLAAGVLGYVWMQTQFPSRMEEELKHKAVEDRLGLLVKDVTNKDSELEVKIGRVADLIAEHAKAPAHPTSASMLQDHTMRITSLEDNQKKVLDRLNTNESLLRDIRAQLEYGGRSSSPVGARR